MANLTITASQVQAVGTLPQIRRVASVSIPAGSAVYITTSDQWALAQCDGTEDEAGIQGIAVASSATGQPALVVPAGVINLGAASGVVSGAVYVVSDTAGLLMPTADLTTTGWYSSIAGIGGPLNTFHVLPFASGEQVP